MKLTKFEHACFVVEQGGQSLVVDPGEYTSDLVSPDNVTVIVITHTHTDHLGRDHIKSIVEKNPEAVIVGHQDVISLLSEYKTQPVTANEGIKMGNFELEFFGGEHAVIAKEIPVIANLGVMINGLIYYPGDSFTLPERPVQVLALPVAAPWMKMSESLEFLKAVQPKLAFPTHDAILSESGKNLPDRMLPNLVKDLYIEYKRLKEPLEI